MNVDDLLNRIFAIGIDRNWWRGNNIINELGAYESNEFKYIRICFNHFNANIKSKLMTYQSGGEILIYFREIIYYFIPKAEGSNIRIYYTDYSSLISNEEARETKPYIVL